MNVVLDDKFTTQHVADEYGNPDLKKILDESFHHTQQDEKYDAAVLCWSIVTRVVRDKVALHDTIEFAVFDNSIYVRLDSKQLDMEIIRNDGFIYVRHGTKPKGGIILTGEAINLMDMKPE